MDEEQLVAFWAQAGEGPGVHPEDRGAKPLIEKYFDIRCLYGSYMGPLRQAQVVLLYSHPGFSDFDLIVAADPALRRIHNSWRTGAQPLPGPAEHETACDWWRHSLKTFEIIDDQELLAAREKLVIYNLFAYHARTLSNAAIWRHIRSSQVARAFANDVLFPRARREEIVVVCMMAATEWGLVRGAQRQGSLFTPMANQRGVLFKKGEHAARRAELIETVRQKLGLQ